MIPAYRRWSSQPLPRARWRRMLLLVLAAAIVALLQRTAWALFPATATATLDGVFVGMLFVVVVRRIHEWRMERRGAGRPG
jgi:hypothetical protein